MCHGSCVGRDSSVGIASRYGLDGSGIESRWGRDFPHPSRPSLGPTQPPMQWVLGLFPGNKVTGTWRWPSTPSTAEVKERVELSPLLPLWVFVACSRVNFKFTIAQAVVAGLLPCGPCSPQDQSMWDLRWKGFFRFSCILPSRYHSTNVSFSSLW
jgi:hypothetical protein